LTQQLSGMGLSSFMGLMVHRISTLVVMSAPEPMLSTAIRSWPDGGKWVLEPKYDGFRVLVEVGSCCNTSPLTFCPTAAWTLGRGLAGSSWSPESGSPDEQPGPADRLSAGDVGVARGADRAGIRRISAQASGLVPIGRVGTGRGASSRARHVGHGVLESVRVARDGQVYAVCDVDGRHVAAVACSSASERVGEDVELVYCRVDAEGALREVRLAAAVSSMRV
jgi:hypothetical protein